MAILEVNVENATFVGDQTVRLDQALSASWAELRQAAREGQAEKLQARAKEVVEIASRTPQLSQLYSRPEVGLGRVGELASEELRTKTMTSIGRLGEILAPGGEGVDSISTSSMQQAGREVGLIRGELAKAVGVVDSALSQKTSTPSRMSSRMGTVSL